MGRDVFLLLTHFGMIALISELHYRLCGIIKTMRRIVLYIAVSLNGKIARSDGNVDWLEKVPNPDNIDYGYKEFLETIDTTIQGNKTYTQLMGWGIDFPYKDKTNFVFTRNQELIDNDNVKFIKNDHVQFIRELKTKEGKGIWVIGGGQLITMLFNEYLIDEIQLFLMPIVISPGIDLIEFVPNEKLMNLIEVHQYSNGVVFMKYRTKV
jgi:dihydrofolate reductase